MVPHQLPDQTQLQALISDLPLRLHSFVDEAQLYIATLQVGATPSIAALLLTCAGSHAYVQVISGAVLQ